MLQNKVPSTITEGSSSNDTSDPATEESDHDESEVSDCIDTGTLHGSAQNKGWKLVGHLLTI